MSERWERLNTIFHAATVLPAVKRSAYLDEACRGDAELRAEAERLIDAHTRAGTVLDAPALALEAFWRDTGLDVAAPGRRFGSYRVLREIAHGGMGTVCLAERADGQFEQRVALKLIRRSFDADLMLRRFRAERQILASLQHPNIARLLDGGTTDDGQPFFVMEYIAGEPIDSYVRTAALPIADRLRLFLTVCDAVAYAHRLGIIHRDIKPANILVTADGTAKLLDFGIAKALVDDGHASTSALTGLRLLTPDYASPEQVEGRQATVASDVYSLGVVLYELLTGHSPYRPRSRDPLDIADAVRTTVPDPPSATTPPLLRRQLRGDLDTIVLAALRKEPERRYPSVGDLAADIRRHLDGLPIAARRENAAYRAGKFLRRNRVAVATGASAVVATALLASVFAGLRAPAEPSLLATGALAERDRIVVSQFRNPRGDSMLAAAVTEAFRIDLAQSPHVRVLTPAQVRDALARMENEATYIADDSVARELAVREGAQAFVTGAVLSVGGPYTVTVQLVSAESGEALAAVRETAADSSELIAAVGRASHTLRERLGESLRELRRMPALEKATTASLPALRKYTEGYRRFIAGERTGIELMEQAVALDPGFASAHKSLANAWEALDEPGRALAAFQQALAQADRLPFRDRQILRAGNAQLLGDHATAIAEYDRLLARYPKDVPALNNQALVYSYARNFAAAESLWHRAIAIDSSIAVLYFGLHTALAHAGRLPEARRTLARMRARFPENTVIPIVEVQQAAAERAWPRAEQLARAHIDRLQSDTLALVDAYEQLAGIVLTQGRLREAERLWRTQIATATAAGSNNRRIFGSTQLGYLKLRYHQDSAGARAIVDSVLALLPLENLLPGDRPYYELARFYAALGDLGRARALLAAGERNDDAAGMRQAAERSWTLGVIACAEGRLDAAATALRAAAASHGCAICPLPDLATAYELAGSQDLALATYQAYLRTPWLWRYESDAIELGRVLTRAGQLHEQRGEADEATRAYAELVATWRAADDVLAASVQHGRSALTRLRAPN